MGSRKWCPMTGETCMGAACAWACEGGCAVAVLAGGGLPAPPARRDPTDRANNDNAGRYAELGEWRPIDYEI